MRIRSRLGKVLLWGTFVLFSSLMGVLCYVFWKINDSETLAGIIRAESPRYLRDAQLEISKVRPRLFGGAINLTQVHVRQMVDGVPFLVLRDPWLHIRHDPRALLKRQFVPLEIEIAQPTLRLCRRSDGSWNIERLLADPWPTPPAKGMPPILIQNGTVELMDEETHKLVAILREVSLRIDPAGPDLLRFDGSAKGDAFDRLNLQGTIDRASGRITLSGELARLAVSETLRHRIPAEFRPAIGLGLASGEIDLQVGEVVYDPKSAPRLHYEGSAPVRRPAQLSEASVPHQRFLRQALARDGVVMVKHTEGYNGPTTVRVAGGRFMVGDPARAPFNLRLELIDLELDKRLEDANSPPVRRHLARLLAAQDASVRPSPWFASVKPARSAMPGRSIAAIPRWSTATFPTPSTVSGDSSASRDSGSPSTCRRCSAASPSS